MIKTYYLLTKPGIIIGNLITAAGAFVLGSRGNFQAWLFLETVVGLGFVIAAACVFNNYIDREVDKKMERTKNRGFASGTVSVKWALILAVFLGIAGLFVLAFYTNLIATLVAGFGFFVYVALYSFWKTKTGLATLVGSVSGAVPPVIGYCAASNTFDLGALLLFAILVLWQMPHFFSIAMYRLEDYAAASIPVLPVQKGNQATKIQMVFYIIAFIALLCVFGCYIAAIPALLWLLLCFRGFGCKDDKVWAKQMFRVSLAVIMVFSVAIAF